MWRLLLALTISTIVLNSPIAVIGISFPRFGQQTQAGLKLNEVVPAPLLDQDEWVELINIGSVAISLDGWMIDDAADTGASVFSLPSLVLAPGTFVRIVTPSMFSNQTSDDVRLLDPGGIESDAFSYAQPERGRAFGRVPDGVGVWLAGLDPTPGAPNLPPATMTPAPTTDGGKTVTPEQSATVEQPTREGPSPTATPGSPADDGVRFNEVAAAGDFVGDGPWLELYNAGTTLVRLEDWRIETGSGSVGVIHDGLMLGPHAWVVFELPAGFLALSDTLSLRAKDGTEFDRFAFVTVVPGRSWSRIPDGTGAWLAERPVSRGGQNIGDELPVPSTTPTVLRTATAVPSATPTASQTAPPISPPTATHTRTTQSTRTPTPTRTPASTRTMTTTRSPTHTRTPSPNSHAFTYKNDDGDSHGTSNACADPNPNAGSVTYSDAHTHGSSDAYCVADAHTIAHTNINRYTHGRA